MTRIVVDINQGCKQRGWTRTRLAYALRQAAAARQLCLPGDESLKRMLRMWSRGRGVSEMYAQLFADLDMPIVAILGEPTRPLPQLIEGGVSVETLADLRAEIRSLAERMQALTAVVAQFSATS